MPEAAVISGMIGRAGGLAGCAEGLASGAGRLADCAGGLADCAGGLVGGDFANRPFLHQNDGNAKFLRVFEVSALVAFRKSAGQRRVTCIHAIDLEQGSSRFRHFAAEKPHFDNFGCYLHKKRLTLAEIGPCVRFRTANPVFWHRLAFVSDFSRWINPGLSTRTSSTSGNAKPLLSTWFFVLAKSDTRANLCQKGALSLRNRTQGPISAKVRYLNIARWSRGSAKRGDDRGAKRESRLGAERANGREDGAERTARRNMKAASPC